MQYVAGFLFSADRKRVALIRKNKPDWQKGRLNGIGGKVEDGETIGEAMVREFEEETGRPTGGWSYFARVGNGNFTVSFFRLFGDCSLDSKTDEIVAWYPIAKLDKLPVIPNLRWLIPLALDDSTRFTEAEVL